jgi:hypothetical protein
VTAVAGAADRIRWLGGSFGARPVDMCRSFGLPVNHRRRLRQRSEPPVSQNGHDVLRPVSQGSGEHRRQSSRPRRDIRLGGHFAARGWVDGPRFTVRAT